MILSFTRVILIEHTRIAQTLNNFMKDAILRAQSLYKKGKYPLALEILESNVSLEDLARLSPDEQLIVLDLLASLCEKQGFMGRARKYASRMIKLKDYDLRGYLRLGKLLQLTAGKVGEALQIYRRALIKVKPLASTHKEFLYRQISLCLQRQSSLDVMDTKGSSSIKVDPMLKLPREVLFLIFSQLGLRQRVRCSLVSWLWFSFIDGEPLLWTELAFDFSSTDSAKPSIISSNTVQKYCDRSMPIPRLSLDFQNVLVRDPKTMLKNVISANASRLQTLLFNTAAPVRDIPVVSMIREALKSSALAHSTGFHLPKLREVRISSENLERDIRWCVEMLPNLEIIDIATASTMSTGSLKPRSFKAIDGSFSSLKPICQHLHTMSLVGRSGTRELSDSMAASLVNIPSLQSVDMHRVVSTFWPALHGAFANPKLVRLGFTADRSCTSNTFFPLPKFAGSLTSLTLNDIALTCVSATPMLPDGSRYLGGSRTAMQALTYVEMKRVTLAEFSLSELINSWGCASSLTTLVVHSLVFRGNSLYPPADHLNFEMLPNLETLQFTGMRNVTNDFLEWLSKACSNLRKVNLDGTSITGPQLVKLLVNMPNLQVVRCRNVVDMSADTVSWVRHLRNVTVIF